MSEFKLQKQLNDSFFNPLINVKASLFSIFQREQAVVNTEEATDNMELSYMDQSFEVLGNNWEGDESTFEILEEFNQGHVKLGPSSYNHALASHAYNQKNQEKGQTQEENRPLLQGTKKTIIKLGITSEAQNFLSKVKTNTIRLFQQQGIIPEESICCTTTTVHDPSKNASPSKVESKINSSEKKNQPFDYYFNKNSNEHIKSEPTSCNPYSNIKIDERPCLRRHTDCASNKILEQTNRSPVQLPFYRRMTQSSVNIKEQLKIKSSPLGLISINQIMNKKSDCQNKVKSSSIIAANNIKFINYFHVDEKLQSNKKILKRTEIDNSTAQTRTNTSESQYSSTISTTNQNKIISKSMIKLSSIIKKQQQQQSVTKQFKLKLNISQSQAKENKENIDSNYQDYDREVSQLMRQMDRDFKCLEKFSEQTLISPNAIVYRPKSTQPVHRKSYSFNSPHILGGFLKRFHQSIHNMQSNNNSIINESDASFMNLEDQSFLLGNKFAL